MVSGGMIYVTNSHDDQLKHSSNIKGITSISEAVVLVLLMRVNYHVHHRHGLRWHDICIPSFMKIGIDVQAILRLYLRNLKNCSFGITD
jgi:hypothetical protein